MINKKYKGRCTKIALSKSENACRAYTPMQLEYAKLLDKSDDIKEIRCNVLLDGLEGEIEYTSDFVCTKTDGELMVRECVYRRLLIKPLTAKLLDMSREYWLRRGVTDWGIVINEEERPNQN